MQRESNPHTHNINLSKFSLQKLLNLKEHLSFFFIVALQHHALCNKNQDWARKAGGGGKAGITLFYALVALARWQNDAGFLEWLKRIKSRKIKPNSSLIKYISFPGDKSFADSKYNMKLED